MRDGPASGRRSPSATARGRRSVRPHRRPPTARDEIVDVDHDPDPTRFQDRAAATALQGGDAALPAAGQAACPIAEAPRPRRGRRGRAASRPRAAGASRRLRPARAASIAGAVIVSRWSASADRSDLVAQPIDDPVGLLARARHDLVAFTPGLAALLGCLPQRFGAADLRRAGAFERLARLALGRLDRGQGLLERTLRVRQARAGVRDDPVRQAEPLGDRERLAAAGQADRQPVRRRQRLEVELDGGVARARASCARTP